ncbi:hypothetical protein B0O99DRAFT_654051 [Bisporella sp. PMI_857]|nr:hypothetical protein B0O99DRAFT_654051 [Bisporella sp. PMI_857]
MRVSLYASLLLVASVLPAIAYVAESTEATDDLACDALNNLWDSYTDGSLQKLLKSKGVAQKCTYKNVAVRREYSSLSNKEKLDYTNSVKCLMRAPSKIKNGLAPGAKSRYDDFVAIHINQTQTIHNTGNFLSWHRYYTWSFERALRDECGYKGYVPYWNWGKSAKDPLNSPYMDGSKYSQGGNGVWAPHNCTRPGSLFAPCIAPVVEGRGGGCVETGPYVGIEANLSAVDTWFNYPNEPAGPFLGYQPRCIKRDISPELSARTQTDAALFNQLTNSSFNDVYAWQENLQSGTGLHSAGHFVFGGNPGGDIYTSPNDPLFWLHHSMIDRTWWIWQNLRPLERLFVIGGTRTMRNVPPSANATLEDIIDLQYITPSGGPTSAIKNHISTVAGPYCYVYV